MSLSGLELIQMQQEYSWETETWFVPLAGAVADLTAAQAAWQPPSGGHTIWQLVNHLTYYKEAWWRRITGAPPQPRAANSVATFGDPGNAGDEAAWQAARERLHQAAAALHQVVAEGGEVGLDVELAGSTRGEVLMLLAMHDVYHTGQIMLLRKQQLSWPQVREEG